MSTGNGSGTPAILEAIRASAGSGKTYALTTRYLGILGLSGGEQPDGILATTFTRKAAGEILGRVLQRLALAADDAPSCRTLARDLESPALTQAECGERLARLCRSLHRVSISTLDSFFTRLSRSFRHELALPADARVLEGDSPAAAALREQAIQALLEELGPEALLRWLEPLQAGMAQRSVQRELDDLFRELYEVYLQTGREAWNRLEVPPDVPDSAVAEAVAALEAAAAELRDKRFRNGIAKNLAQVASEDWMALLENGLAAKVRNEDLTYYNQPVPAVLLEPYQVLIRRATSRLLQRCADQSRATFELLRRFDTRYRALRQRQRALLFSDIPRALAQVLPERKLEEIAYRMDARIDHLLLDEFQDTSPEQWQVLRPFAARIHALADTPASIFCVGDVKQAIYGWRGGCAEIFDRLGEELQGLSWRSMDESYRSSQVVLDAVHAVFGALESSPALAEHRAAGDLWQARYQRHTARKELPGYVELTTAAAEGAAEAEDEAREADEEPAGGTLAEAARLVARLAAAAPRATIGVLLRTNAPIREMLFHLQQCGVPSSGEGGSPVDDVPEVEVILAALTLGDHPGDSAAAYRLAASPLGAELGLSEAGARRPGRRARAARRIRRRLVAEGYAAVVAAWAGRLAASADERGVTRLGQLVQLAELHGRQPSLRPAEFVRLARETPIEEPTPARVRVMSIHRAKGLEFDAVVLPELQKRIGTVRGPLLLDRPDPTEPIQAVFSIASKGVRSLSPQLQAAHARQQRAEVQESLCLLYVAMTRARHALYMLVPPLQKTSKGEVKKAPFSYASILRAALKSPDCEEGFSGGVTLHRSGDPEWTRALAGAAPPPAASSGSPAPIRLAPSGNGDRASREVTPSSLERGGRVRAADLLALTKNEGQEYGTLMHAWLAEVGWADEPLPEETELLRLAGVLAPGRPEAWYRARLEEWREWLRDPQVRALLTRPTGCEVDLWREQRFAVPLGKTLLHGTFDRVAIHRTGAEILAVELLDYKTDRVERDGVDARAELYRPQIAAYREALAAMLRVDPGLIRARLLFLYPRVCVEVPAG